MFRLEKRPTPSKAWTIAIPILAVLATMIAGGLLFGAVRGNGVNLLNPFGFELTHYLKIFGITDVRVLFDAEAIRTIFWDPLFSEQFAAYSRPQLLVKAGPLILIAIGLSFGFRAGIWNIGAEGQYIMGAIAGAAVGLAFYPAGGWYVFPLMVIAGAFGGFLWAMIPAILRTRFNTNEILVSLLLVYVAEHILSAMSFGLLRNPDGHGFPGSRNFSEFAAAANPELIANSGMHWGVVAAFIAVIFAYVIMTRHLLGYQITLAGQSPRAARFGGVNPNRLIVLCFGLAGVLAGAAGLFEVTGPAKQLTENFGQGYGYTAIIVAFLGRLHPVGILLAGLLMALTYIGGDLAQLMLGLPAPAIQAFQGMLLFFLLAMDVLSNFRIRFKKPEAA